MAGSFASTDSSRTLSGIIPSSPTATSTALITTLSSAPHEFLRPSSSVLQDAALALAKRYLDPLMKSKPTDMGLDRVFLEGFDVDQVWEQVKGVVELGDLPFLEKSKKKKEVKRLRFAEEEESSSGSGSDSDSGGGGGESDEEMMGGGEQEEEEEENFDGFAEEEDQDDEEGGLALGSEDEEDIEDGEEGIEEDDDEEEEKEFIQDKFGLNDGFFSIDEFNRQSELLELEDQRGRLADDSDDDDIDFHANPAEMADEDQDEDEDEDDAGSDADLEESLKKMQNGDNGQMVDGYNNGADDDEDEDEDEDEDGDIDMDGNTGDNTNDIMYADFFAPPAKKKNKHEMIVGHIPKSKQSWRKRAALDTRGEGEINAEMERARRDIFAGSDDEDDEEEDENADPSDPLNRRSSHQKRQAALTEQIRQLEATAVAKRDWTLQGEANSHSRPLNSLLEKDLDFERTGKPAPVITAEVTESLEELIKRRILTSEFDEVLKRRPDEVASTFRRGRVQIDDAKPQHSLAEIYEKEYQAALDPARASAADEKLSKAHKEIESLWGDVSRKLDALSSWHYTPKPPKPSLTVVADAPAISMEDAQPGIASAAAAVSMLAPQEIYQPGKDKAVLPTGTGGGREIITKGGAPVSTREMTSDEKKRRRRREKQKIRKRNMEQGVGVRGEVKEGSRKDVVDTLRKGGVKFIGHGGEKRDVEGNVVKGDGLDRPNVKANFLKL